MPQLPLYNAPLGGLPEAGGRQATPEDAGTPNMYAVERLNNTLTQVYETHKRQLEDDDERKVIVGVQKLKADAIATVDRALIDPSVDLEKYKEDYVNKLSDLESNATTPKARALAEQHTVLAVSELSHTMAQMQARKVGDDLKQSVITFDAAASARLQKDPGALADILKERQQLIGTFANRVSPDLMGMAETEGAQHLSTSSAQSLIEKDPNAALFLLQNETGVFAHLTPEARAGLINLAQAGVKSKESDSLKAQQEQHRLQQKANSDALEAMAQDFAAGKGNAWTSPRILAQQGIDPAYKVEMLRVYDYLTKNQTDGSNQPPDVVATNDAYTRIFLPESNPRRIETQQQIDALLLDGKILPNEHAHLINTLKNREKPDELLANNFLSRVEQMINPRDALGQLLSPDGPMNAWRFRRDLTALRDQWQKEGKPVEDLFNPDSKDFQSRVLPLLRKYQVDTSKLVKAQAPSATAGGPAVVSSQAELDKLAPGTEYTVPGSTKLYRKAGGPAPTGAKESSSLSDLAKSLVESVLPGPSPVKPAPATIPKSAIPPSRFSTAPSSKNGPAPAPEVKPPVPAPKATPAPKPKITPKPAPGSSVLPAPSKPLKSGTGRGGVGRSE